MSRTLKDKPSKLKFDAYMKDMIRVEGTYKHIWTKTTKTKKRKEVDTEDHWMGTPGWWVKMTMNKPGRRKQHLLEKKVLKVEDIEEFDFPEYGRKPHIYFW